MPGRQATLFLLEVVLSRLQKSPAARRYLRYGRTPGPRRAGEGKMKRMLVLPGLLLAAAVAVGQENPGPLPADLAAVSLPAAPQERLETFDPRALRLAWNNRRWQLVSKDHVIKDFGFREAEARQALRVIQELGLNQHGTVGSPYPVMEYWLRDGQAPQGQVRVGVRAMALEPTALRVEL